MTGREAASLLDAITRTAPLPPSTPYGRAMILAKQALEILATLEERVKLFEIVELKRLASDDWRVMFDGEYHAGDSPADVLGQLCQVLSLDETREPKP